LWLDDDQDAALAYLDLLAEDRAQRCPSCGTLPGDWIDPATGHDYRDPPYLARVIECEGCRAIADAREELTDETGKSIVLVPNTGDDEDASNEMTAGSVEL